MSPPVLTATNLRRRRCLWRDVGRRPLRHRLFQSFLGEWSGSWLRTGVQYIKGSMAGFLLVFVGIHDIYIYIYIHTYIHTYIHIMIIHDIYIYILS